MSVDREYRFRIAPAGASDMSAPAITVTQAPGADGFLTGSDSWGGSKIYPIEGRAESLPWKVTIGESQAGEEFTRYIADGAGRAQLLRRICDISSRPPGGAWTVEATGRITDLSESGPGEWTLSVQDERLIERTARIFGAAEAAGPTDLSGISVIAGAETTSIYPMGLLSDWERFSAAGGYSFAVDFIVDNLVYLQLTQNYASYPDSPVVRDKMTLQIEQLMKDDLKEGSDASGDLFGVYNAKSQIPGSLAFTEGDFETLIARVDGVDRELTAAGLVDESGQRRNQNGAWHPTHRTIVVVWPDTPGDPQPALGDEVKAYLLMPTHEPTRALPKHLGGAAGIHPMDLCLQILQALGVRADAAAFGALAGDRSIPNIWPRITGEQNAYEYINKQLCQPFGIALSTSAAGEVVPIRTALPTADDVADVTALPRLTEKDVSEHPTWEHSSTELVTRVLMSWDGLVERGHHHGGSEGDIELPSDIGADLLEVQEHVERRDHDRLADFGVAEQELEVRAIHDAEVAGRVADLFSEQAFQRFGDGPVRTRLPSLDAARGLAQGDFCLLNIPTYPNLASASRGGDRLVQVISAVRTLDGPELEILDAGPALQPLTSPSLSAAQNVDAPSSTIDVTVSSVPAGAFIVLQVAQSVSEPAADSSAWQTVRSWAPGGTTFPIVVRASGSTWWFRARATKAGRVTSLWSAAVSAVTAPLDAPTGLAFSHVSGCSALATWTVGDEGQSVEVTVGGARVGVLPAGSEQLLLTDRNAGLTVSGSFTVAVRHVDASGSPGPSDSATLDTTGSAETGPGPGGLEVLAGDDAVMV